jgi:hypothetical protein
MEDAENNPVKDRQKNPGIELLKKPPHIKVGETAWNKSEGRRV